MSGGMWVEDVYVENALDGMEPEYSEAEWEPEHGTCVHCGGDIVIGDCTDDIWMHAEGETFDHLARPTTHRDDPCCLTNFHDPDKHAPDCPCK